MNENKERLKKLICKMIDELEESAVNQVGRALNPKKMNKAVELYATTCEKTIQTLITGLCIMQDDHMFQMYSSSVNPRNN